MDNSFTEAAVRRIGEMERVFDLLLDGFSKSPEACLHDGAFREDLRRLTEYYTGGLWLEDYLLDEQNLLPGHLKRGVLSEDGVHNLLSALQRYHPADFGPKGD